MVSSLKRPKRLYKYRRFNTFTIEMLVADNIYYAPPTAFNDPLDSKPILCADVDTEKLKYILYLLAARRLEAELSLAVRLSQYPASKLSIKEQSKSGAERLLKDIRYYGQDPFIEAEDPEKLLLRQYIHDELLKQYDKGVFSLTEKDECPLMWSHYGDEHRGLCLGYSIPNDERYELYKVKYGGNRTVKASTVFAALQGDEEAEKEINAAALLAKTRSWCYEREWRLIGPQGTQRSLFKLEEVIFGMRCPSSVKFTVIKTLEARNATVEFSEMHECAKSFRLKKRQVTIDELNGQYSQGSTAISCLFGDLP